MVKKQYTPWVYLVSQMYRKSGWLCLQGVGWLCLQVQSSANQTERWWRKSKSDGNQWGFAVWLSFTLRLLFCLSALVFALHYDVFDCCLYIFCFCSVFIFFYLYFCFCFAFVLHCDMTWWYIMFTLDVYHQDTPSPTLALSLMI